MKLKPDLSEARRLRQEACEAGLDPAYWYPVEWEPALKARKVIGVRLGDIAVALFRAGDGTMHAIEDRCAHRQVRLSHGFVDGCKLRCVYHGWTYATDGRLIAAPQQLFGNPLPSVQLRTFPVAVRYGMIWIFFGDSALAEQRPIPTIPELEGDKPWTCIALDAVWRARPAMIVNNFMDSTHVDTLHNRQFATRSVKTGPLTECRANGDRVIVRHQVTTAPKGLLSYIGEGFRDVLQENNFDYPYLWASVGTAYRLWTLMLPIDEHHTRVFLLSLTRGLKIPFTPWLLPTWMNGLWVPFTRRFLINPLLGSDGWSAEIEYEGYERNLAVSPMDFHPAPPLCYRLTVRKWQEHLATQSTP